MAKKDYDNEDGVWRTVGGRRIFIKNGQDLASAMIESGKFKNLRSDYRKAKEEDANKKINPMEEYSDTNGKGMTDAQEKILNAVKTSFLYKDEGEMSSGLQKNYELYGKENVDSALKYYGDNYELIKGVASDSEGLTYNDLIKKDEYPENALKYYKNQMKELKNSGLQYKDSKAYNDKADALKEELEKSKDGAKEENERLEIAKDIAKELNASLKSASDERLEKEAREILSPPDGYVLDKGETTYTNANGEIERSTESLKKWRDDLKKTSENKESFTQKSTSPFYPDRDYTQEELKKMEDAGIRPTKNSYSGSGWEGVNSDKNLSTKEQAKAITDAMKEKYPDVKISRKSELYSGGSSIHLDIMSSDKDLYVSDADIDKMSLDDLAEVRRSNGFNWWAKDNVSGYKENKAMFTDKDIKTYAKQRLAEMKKGDNQSVRGDEWYLSDYGKKVVSDLNKTANSYTYDDSDAMTDYYNHGTYMWVNIGKWDKPYQVNEKATGETINNTIRQKAYKKYLKEHPGSKMSFEDFKDMRK